MPEIIHQTRKPYLDNIVDRRVAERMAAAAIQGRIWTRDSVMTLEVIDDEFVLTWSTK